MTSGPFDTSAGIGALIAAGSQITNSSDCSGSRKTATLCLELDTTSERAYSLCGLHSQAVNLFHTPCREAREQDRPSKYSPGLTRNRKHSSCKTHTVHAEQRTAHNPRNIRHKCADGRRWVQSGHQDDSRAEGKSRGCHRKACSSEPEARYKQHYPSRAYSSKGMPMMRERESERVQRALTTAFF